MSRRVRYRVRQRRRFLTVFCDATDGFVSEGSVEDLSVQGSGAWFPTVTVGSIDVGDEVELEFRALLLTDPLRARAVVRHREVQEDLCRLGFEFADPEDVESRVPYVLLREFNRRSFPRIAFEDDVDIAFRVKGESKFSKGWLIDLSPGGLGFAPPAEQEGRLALGDLVEVSFQLDEVAEELRWCGTVRTLRTEGLGVVCGIEFDTDATEDTEHQEILLETFIAGASKHDSAQRA